MRVAHITVAVLIGLLSLAAGAAKIALVPEERSFLGQFGFTDALTIAFGIVQVLGGLLIMFAGTRFFGAILAGAAFALSFALLLVGGQLAFAALSLVPVGLAGVIAYQCHANRLASEVSEIYVPKKRETTTTGDSGPTEGTR